MRDFKVIVTIFVIACVKCYHQCHSEENIGNSRFNRTVRDILWITAKITVDVRDSFHPVYIYNPEDRFAFYQYPARFNLPTPAPVRPAPMWSAPLQPTLDSVKPITLAPSKLTVDPVEPITLLPPVWSTSLKPTLEEITTVGPEPVEPTTMASTAVEQDQVKPIPLVPTTVGPNPVEKTSVEPTPVVPITVVVESDPLEPISVDPTTVQSTPSEQTSLDLVPVELTTVNQVDRLASSGFSLKKDANKLTSIGRSKFDGPGRRISEAKCDEIVSDYKKKVDERNMELSKAKSKRRGTRRRGGTHAYAGRNSLTGEFPHMGEMGWRDVNGGWKFQCAASLISEKFLLTAAHCSSVPPRDPTLQNTKPEIVRIGVKIVHRHILKGQRFPEDYEIAQIIVHPQFAPPKKYYDIALVELKSEVPLGFFIWPACLWSQHDTSPLGNRSLVSGWGYVDQAQTELASELQVSEVDMIDSVFCDKLLEPAWDRNFNGLQSHQLCAGELETGADACPGDSGGPLQVKIPLQTNLSYVIGVTSFGRGCGRKNSPGVYTRVSSFIDWIEDIVWPNEQ